MHLIGLTPDLKGIRDRTKQTGFFAFSIVFSSTQPAPVFGNADFRYHLSRLNKNT